MNRLILVRGVPGSGKSTYARSLLERNIEYVHFEADMWFERNGKYEFDAKKLGQAHAWCRTQTEDALRAGKTVIVSNTFTTIKELVPYFNISKDVLGTNPYVYTCEGEYESIHDVPRDKIKQMRERFVTDISELYDASSQ